jgi:hypothetical protein
MKRLDIEAADNGFIVSYTGDELEEIVVKVYQDWRDALRDAEEYLEVEEVGVFHGKEVN